MKKIPLILLLICIGYALFSPSCANTTTPPSGGRKDTLPPILVRTTPTYNSVNFSGKRIDIKFNEYIKLTDITNQIYLSPPQAKRLKAEVRGKSVVVTFPAPLDTNATYTVYFGNSIVDNNEGNPYGPYTFSFSTGSVIDSLLFSGYVVDAKTLLPLDNISVMLHTQESDTTIYKTLPRAMAKTDLWGYFAVLNLKELPYGVFAVEDVNRNNRYDDNNEMVAFLEEPFIPKAVMVADSFALERIDPKDTLKMLARPVERTLYLFKEAPKRQVLREKARPHPRHFYFTFSAPLAQINSIEIDGVDSLSLICEHSFRKDTIRYWITDSHIPDTLKGVVNYMKTDSLNALSPGEEKFTLLLPKENQDTSKVLKINVTSQPEFVEQKGILFSFHAYPVELKIDSVFLSYKGARDEVIKVPFSFLKDSLDGCKYSLMPEKWVPAASYDLNIPRNVFKDVYGRGNDSLVHKVTLPEADQKGSITLKFEGGIGMYIVELLDKTREKVLRTVHIPSDGKGVFPYLADGEYVIRITEDSNGNGVWDTGSLDQRIPPERVRFFRLSNGVDLIEIKNMLELEQNIEIEELFNYDARPIVPTKTKR
ncbi:MAG: Ig-like domain-containing protein [Bacteroidales bacterium]|nr:Ig-like domain-containing protein [Bacteroidales bacterium]